jgi:hypothetical protein
MSIHISYKNILEGKFCEYGFWRFSGLQDSHMNEGNIITFTNEGQWAIFTSLLYFFGSDERDIERYSAPHFSGNTID